MDSMRDIAREAMAQMPPGCQLQRSDGEIIARHRDLLLGLERELVTGFYDTLFAHGVTAAVFAEGERPTREDTLGAWWRRTVRGPLDDDYFAWMALVGLVHVIREVSNPMMLAMTEYVRTMVADQARTALADPHERGLLVDAFGRNWPRPWGRSSPMPTTMRSRRRCSRSPACRPRCCAGCATPRWRPRSRRPVARTDPRPRTQWGIAMVRTGHHVVWAAITAVPALPRAPALTSCVARGPSRR